MEQGDVFFQTFTIGPDVYEGFIKIFNDQNPMHVNEEYAKDHGYKGRVMHGNILNGFLSYFIGECLPAKNVVIQSQEIKYSHPVYLNETVTLRAEVEHVFESVNTVEFKYFFEDSNKKKVAKGKIQISVNK